jgi:DNA polymerase I-like protein with 3'-5' exonuclease and polymerase domains
MPALLCLAQMELNGIGFSRDKAEHLRDILKQQLKALEQHAYKLVGHTFSLTSSVDVSKVKTKCRVLSKEVVVFSSSYLQ